MPQHVERTETGNDRPIKNKDQTILVHASSHKSIQTRTLVNVETNEKEKNQSSQRQEGNNLDDACDISQKNKDNASACSQCIVNHR